MPRLTKKRIEEIYMAVLHRHPDPEGVRSYRAGNLTAEDLVQALRTSVEYRTIILPVEQQVRDHFQTWYRRLPTETETKGVFRTLRNRFDTETLRRRARGATLRRAFDERPLVLEMDITNQCNLRCKMCMFSHPDYYLAKSRHWTVPEFRALADQLFAATRRVSLSFGTEPLLHRDIDQLLAVLEEHEVPHKYFNTNGQLMGAATITAMIRHRMDTVTVSVDAATGATYERVRVGASWDKLHSNLQTLRDLKARNGVRYPALALAFVMMRENMHELPAFIDLAADSDAVGVNVTHMVAFDAIDNESMAAVHERARCNEFLRQATERAKARGVQLARPNSFVEHGVDTERARDSVDGARQRFALDPETDRHAACPFPWTFVAIDKDRQVQPCGWWFGVPPMGNLDEQSFLEIWNGDAYERLRRDLQGPCLQAPCTTCPAAGMADPNHDSAFNVVA